MFSRFRQVPTFGRSTIRRFSTNASEMKKLAARNFEDLLQVSAFVLFSFKIMTLWTQIVCNPGF
jgi:hypothetical protein